MGGKLIVLSGPSGAGKGSLCEKLIERTGAELSISATTRKRREGETEGVDYFFKTEEEFVDLINNDGFIEHVENFGRRYGTLASYVSEKNKSGKDIILEIDVQGGKKIRNKYPDAVLIMVLPPSYNDLEKRLRKRGTETEEEIGIRIGKAVREIAKIWDYDYYIINDDLERAVADGERILGSVHTGKDNVSDLKVTPEKAEQIQKKFEEEERNALSGNK